MIEYIFIILCLVILYKYMTISKENFANTTIHTNNYKSYNERKCQPIINKQPNDVKEFINGYFDFRNYVYNTSHQLDPVDKMTEMKMDPDKFKGMRIQDIYDTLTGADITIDQKKLKTPYEDDVYYGDVASPMINQVSSFGTNPDNSHTPHGQYIEQANIEYENEEPTNGGLFYTDIYSNDIFGDDRYVNKGNNRELLHKIIPYRL